MELSHASRQVLFEMCNMTPFKELVLLKEAMEYIGSYPKESRIEVTANTIDDPELKETSEVEMSKELKKNLKEKLDDQDKFAWAGFIYVELDNFFNL